MKKRGREYHPGKHKQGTITSKRGATLGSRDTRGHQRYLLKKRRNNKRGVRMWNNKPGVGSRDVE
jgi:hypothetical protein